MGRTLRILAGIFIPLVTLVLGWQLGAEYQHQKYTELMGTEIPNGTVSDPETEVDISLMWSVWRLLIQHYVNPEDLNATNMVYGAIEGMVGGVGDPYTAFMSPKENKAFQDALQGHLEGIGAELTQKENIVMVVAPLKGSPAAAAGLKPEDIIIEVDGQSTEGWDLSEVVTKVRGPKGTDVSLKVFRSGETAPLEFTITRQEITVPSVEFSVKESAKGPIGYISLNQFGEDSIKEVREALDSHLKANVKGIVLDLRYNGGGYLDGATELVSLFLKEGMVVSVERRDGEPEVQSVSGNTMAPDIPLVVLVNEGSASAAEIAAGALKDHKRATIIGKKTFGKGTVQEVINLPGGSSLRVTIAKWLTPNGTDIGKEGIHPDIEVELTKEDVEAEKDPQLEKALETVSAEIK